MGVNDAAPKLGVGGDPDRVRRFRHEAAQLEKADSYLDQVRHFDSFN